MRMKTRTLLKLASFAASLGAGVAVTRNLVRTRRTIDLAGKTVVITGGSRGLGLVLARGLVKLGARVAICARDAAELERARANLVTLGGEVYAATCDVSERDEVLRFITAVEDDFGAIDVLVNNAGIIQVGPLATMTEEDFQHALDVNFYGPLHAIYAVLPGMRRRKAGRIVNIASIGGKVAVPHLAPYSASKFALVGLSEALRAELTAESIYVTTVVPGLMRTGSPRHAWFKGKVEAEYAWFSIGDSNSLTSVSAEAASRRIIEAFTHGDAEVTISPQAKAMSVLHGIAPNLVQEMLCVVARVMPGATQSRTAVEGKDAGSALAPSALTRNSDEAAARNNEN